jgi:hypothetical protein
MARIFVIVCLLLQISGCGGGAEFNSSIFIPVNARADLEKTLVEPPTLLTPLDALISTQSCTQDITNSEEIILKKGIYCFKGLKYNLSSEGLFRIFDFHNKLSRQIIVYEYDIFKLLSSFAWVVKHGNGDDKYYPDSLDVLKKILINSSLSLTCGPLSIFFGKILNELGIENRLVRFSRDSNFNGFDDGHILLEVRIGKKWSAVDLDNNNIFMTPDLQTLSALQITLQPTNLQSRLRIADDEGDYLNFRDGTLNYGFYAESQNINTWYEQIMRVISINGKYFCPKYKDCSGFQKNNPSLELVTEAEFVKLFYSDI